MSLSTQTLKRLPTIKKSLIQGLNRDRIGAKCGVTEKTIDRDVTAWVESGLFEIWIKEEFLRLHPKICKKDVIEAYRNVCKLVAKMVTRRIETKAEITERVTVDVDIREYIEAIESAVNRDKQSLAILQKTRSPKQMDPKQS